MIKRKEISEGEVAIRPGLLFEPQEFGFGLPDEPQQQQFVEFHKVRANLEGKAPRGEGKG